jgi:uncharacterized protein YecT (DUF1311 family)
MAVVGFTGCRAPDVGAGAQGGAVVPQGWEPGMQSTKDYFAEKLQHFDASQMELNILSSQQAIAADGRLFITYVRLWECLNPKARDQLFQEQEDWLKRRPGLARDRNEYPEGSISPMTLAIAYTEVTLERLNILEHRLESLRYVGNRVRGATGVSGQVGIGCR